MKPEWFLFEKIPHQKMWAATSTGSRALRGEKLRGKVWFKEDATSIENMEWTIKTDITKVE